MSGYVIKLHINPQVEKYKNNTNIATKALAGVCPRTKTKQIAEIIAMIIVIKRFLKKPIQAKIKAFLISCLNDSLNVTIITKI